MVFNVSVKGNKDILMLISLTWDFLLKKLFHLYDPYGFMSLAIDVCLLVVLKVYFLKSVKDNVTVTSKLRLTLYNSLLTLLMQPLIQIYMCFHVS